LFDRNHQTKENSQNEILEEVFNPQSLNA
jgi:hypothetical protein